MYKLSIIVPVYNTGKYVRECIESLYKQSNIDLEVIVVNDGSTDDSQDILNELKFKYTGLIVLNQVNKGVSAARNYGKSIASGDYITFVDSDDTIDENTYYYIIKNMVNSNADVSIFAFRRWLSSAFIDDLLPWNNLEILDRNEIRDTLIPLMFSSMDNKRMISGSVCRSVFKKEVIENLCFNETVAMQEDLLFCIYAYNNAKNIQIVNREKYNYVKHDGTTTEKYRKRFYEESVKFEDEQIKALKNIGVFNNMKKQYQSNRMDMYSLCLSNLFRFDAPTDISEELKIILAGFKKDENLIGVKLKNLNARNRILFVLMQLKCEKILKLIYKKKEIKRRRKLAQ